MAVAQLIKEIIAVDCTTQGTLHTPSGGFCFIGGLYACINPDWACDRAHKEGVPETNRLRRIIEDTFGLNRGELQGGYAVNDRFLDLHERRAALTSWIEKRTE